MINKIENKGFTLAEALVAMLLVAVMAAGIITALMSTKRAIIAPSNKEDMIFAIEKAASLLQMADEDDTVSGIFGPFNPANCSQSNCCSSTNLALALTPECDKTSGDDCHMINCLKPFSCQAPGDFFAYDVSQYDETNSEETKKLISFVIKCEGQSI